MEEAPACGAAHVPPGRLAVGMVTSALACAFQTGTLIGNDYADIENIRMEFPRFGRRSVRLATRPHGRARTSSGSSPARHPYPAQSPPLAQALFDVSRRALARTGAGTEPAVLGLGALLASMKGSVGASVATLATRQASRRKLKRAGQPPRTRRSNRSTAPIWPPFSISSRPSSAWFSLCARLSVTPGSMVVA